MELLIRTLLVWLLVLAVPAQGMAATTMALCGPNHHGGTAASTVLQPANAAHSEALGSTRDAHDHHGMQAMADEARPSNADRGAHQPVAHTSKQKCSACASCCSIGAILHAVVSVPAPVLTPTLFSVVVPSVGAFAVDGPDRPPRSFLA